MRKTSFKLDGILNSGDLIEKARRIIEESDSQAAEDIFSGCKNNEDVNSVAAELYDDLFNVYAINVVEDLNCSYEYISKENFMFTTMNPADALRFEAQDEAAEELEKIKKYYDFLEVVRLYEV